MAFLHSHSTECMSSELDIFSLPPTQPSIESSSFLHYKPVSSLRYEGDTPIEFVVPSGSEHYIDLAHTMLYIQAMVEPIEAEAENAKVAPVNNFLHSLFNQVEVFFNQKLVSPPNNAYPYRAYIELLLNYSPAAKESHLTTVLWYDDTHENFEAVPNIGMDNAAANKGALYRQHSILGGKAVNMIENK